MLCFMTVAGILNCNCCNTVVCKANFLSPISQNGTLYSSQIDLSITFEPIDTHPTDKQTYDACTYKYAVVHILTHTVTCMYKLLM